MNLKRALLTGVLLLAVLAAAKKKDKKKDVEGDGEHKLKAGDTLFTMGREDLNEKEELHQGVTKQHRTDESGSVANIGR